MHQLSRRRWIGSALATCGGVAVSGLTLGQEVGKMAPEGYTKPGPVADLNLAPGLQIRKVSEHPNGEVTYALIFGKRDEVLSGLTAFATQQKITAGYFTAIGALQRAKFGWFDLYPDALVALILPASTVPSDLVLAARYIASNGDPAQIANQPWDDSVKSLVRYPDILHWMDQNLEWTTAVGEAFLDQPADVMNSIQGLRAEAVAAGNLTDTPQQHVVQEETGIRIVPAQPDLIYVPQYDPDVVYAQPNWQNVGPLLTFGAGFAVGSWLNYDCDWGRHSIYVGQWRPGWNHDRKWDRWVQGQNNNSVNVVNINGDTARQWQPSANSQRRQAQHERSNPSNARISNVNAVEANHQRGGPSTPNVITRADPGPGYIPKPLRPDYTSHGNEKNRREVQDANGSPKTSIESPPSPDVAPNTPHDDQHHTRSAGQNSQGAPAHHSSQCTGAAGKAIEQRRSGKRSSQRTEQSSIKR
jgi:Protein of unknown function (DUF3300)